MIFDKKKYTTEASKGDKYKNIYQHVLEGRVQRSGKAGNASYSLLRVQETRKIRSVIYTK